MREEGGEIFWRENGRFACFRPPERFETQHGSFENHDRGEFGGWLESAGDPERLRIFGNFCDMFDCGAYSFAVSNLMHRGAGDFWLMRIDAGLNSAAVFSNKAISGRDFDIRRVGGSEGRWRSFDYEYLGRFRNGRGYALLLRGWKRVEGYGTRHRTLLLQTGPEGGCSVDGEWETKLSSAYSLAVRRLRLFRERQDGHAPGAVLRRGVVFHEQDGGGTRRPRRALSRRRLCPHPEE